MEVFDHDEKGFARWRDKNPDGYVLNESTGKLHWRISRCRNFKEFKPPRPWTSNRKLCFDSRAALRAWERKGGSYSQCKSCSDH